MKSGARLHLPDHHEEFLIRDGDLYLRSQTVRSAPILVSWVKTYPWGPEEIRDLLRRHPELSSHFQERGPR